MFRMRNTGGIIGEGRSLACASFFTFKPFAHTRFDFARGNRPAALLYFWTMIPLRLLIEELLSFHFLLLFSENSTQRFYWNIHTVVIHYSTQSLELLGIWPISQNPINVILKDIVRRAPKSHRIFPRIAV